MHLQLPEFASLFSPLRFLPQEVELTLGSIRFDLFIPTLPVALGNQLT